jgi:hypothetical protein
MKRCYSSQMAREVLADGEYTCTLLPADYRGDTGYDIHEVAHEHLVARLRMVVGAFDTNSRPTQLFRCFVVRILQVVEACAVDIH